MTLNKQVTNKLRIAQTATERKNIKSKEYANCVEQWQSVLTVFIQWLNIV